MFLVYIITATYGRKKERVQFVWSVFSSFYFILYLYYVIGFCQMFLSVGVVIFICFMKSIGLVKCTCKYEFEKK